MIFTGVALYTIQEGQVYFILGKELNGELNIFGGGPKSSDYSLEAAREFEEETMGIFGSAEDILPYLSSCPKYQTDDVTIFLCRIEIIWDQLMILQQAFQNLYRHFSKCSICPEGYLEMTDILFVPKDQIETYNLRPAFRRQLSSLLKIFPLNG